MLKPDPGPMRYLTATLLSLTFFTLLGGALLLTGAWVLQGGAGQTMERVAVPAATGAEGGAAIAAGAEKAPASPAASATQSLIPPGALLQDPAAPGAGAEAGTAAP